MKMPRKLIADLEAEIAARDAKIVQLTSELATLKALEAPASPPAKRPMPASQGTVVFCPPPESTLVMPNDGDLHRLMDIALTAYPSLRPKIELSFQQRLTLRNIPSLADQIKPDVEAISADYFREFRAAFVAIGSMKRMDEPDRRHYASFHVEAAQSWLRSHSMFADIPANAFIAAALAHGDVLYTDGAVDGSLWELGISVYVGKPAGDAWRGVLKTGKLRPATAVPAARRMAVASPARIY
jgi:hypothetical protein